MNISSIYNNANAVSYLTQMLSAQATGSTSPATTNGIGGTGQSSDSSSISQSGQLFSALQNLQTSDPTKFKQLMTDEAAKLQSAAAQAGSSTSQGQALTSLAQKFQDVANGGSLSELQPVAHHHHHHGSGGAQATYNQAGQVSSDQSQAIPGLPVTQSTSSGSSSIQQIMQSVFSDLEQAVKS